MRRLALLTTLAALALPGVAQANHRHRPRPCAVTVGRHLQVTPCHTCRRYGWCLGR